MPASTRRISRQLGCISMCCSEAVTPASGTTRACWAERCLSNGLLIGPMCASRKHWWRCEPLRKLVSRAAMACRSVTRSRCIASLEGLHSTASSTGLPGAAVPPTQMDPILASTSPAQPSLMSHTCTGWACKCKCNLSSLSLLVGYGRQHGIAFKGREKSPNAYGSIDSATAARIMDCHPGGGAAKKKI